MENIAKLEALLFFYGEPVDMSVIARILGITLEECEKEVSHYEQILSSSNGRGLLILRKGNSIQLATKPELKEIGEAIVKDEFRESLTPAALETLALVAYLSPVTRATIDYIRGVNSSYSMRNLSLRGLVERGEEKGASFRYSPTQEFLKHIGVQHVKMLPEYERYHSLLQTFARTMEEVSVSEHEEKNPETPFDEVPKEKAE
ncbi:MAG: SMC-Scp complex subunit ScpB [Candidatus Paceibacterota bacterium]|jgi:segregation and condensation protein B